MVTDSSRRQPVLRGFVCAAVLLFLAGGAAAQPGSLPEIRLSRCDCQWINVVCSDAEIRSRCGSVAAACASRSGCTIYLSSKLCSERGLGSRGYSFPELGRHMGCGFAAMKRALPQLDWRDKTNWPQLKAMAASAGRCAQMWHEVTHVCASRKLSGRRTLACGETAAYQAQEGIYQHAFNELCADVRLRKKGGLTSPLCQQLCVDAYKVQIPFSWVDCICDRAQRGGALGEWLTPVECCGCYRRCLKGHFDAGASWMPPFCRSEIFSRQEFKKEMASKAALACDRLAFTDDGYPCSKFSKNPFDAAQRCGK